MFVHKDGEPKVVDYEFYFWPWSGFLALEESTQDLFHYPYQHAVILHDPDGRIAPVVARLAELPEDVRQARLRVHYLEFRFALGRARKTARRGGEIDLRLLRGDALAALVKLLFLAVGSWPATHHWTEPELRLLEVPDELMRQVERTFSDPTSEAPRQLVEAIEAWLDGRGETFYRDLDGLMTWTFHRSEGKRAFEQWGGR